MLLAHIILILLTLFFFMIIRFFYLSMLLGANLKISDFEKIKILE